MVNDRTTSSIAAETQANLRLLLDATAECFYAVDRDGVTTLCNAAFLRLIGFAREEDALGRKLHDLIHHTHPDGSSYDVSECPIYRCASGAKPAHVTDETFYRLDGTPVPVEYWATPIFREGEHQGAICTFYDVTERRQAEAALRESDARLRALNADLERRVTEGAHERGRTWDVSPHLLSVISLETGCFLRVNPAWTATLGWSQDELADAPFADLLHPDDAAASAASFGAVRGGEAVLDFENRYRRKDGDYRWLSWVSVPEDDKLYSTARDVTEEKAQAAALAERTIERDRLWSNSQDVLIVIDPAGVFQDVNPAATRVLGFAAAEMIGRPVFEFIHPDDLPIVHEALATATEGELPITAMRYRHKSGGHRWLAWVAAPDNGLIYASGRHVTAEREAADALAAAQEALRQSQKLEAIGQLTGGVAHDFNNLLTVIRGSVELLRRPAVTDGKRERYLAAIADASDRAATLTGQLLAFARRQALKPAVFDVRRSVEAVSDMIATLMGSRVAIAIELPDVACGVLADPSQFDTALVNMAVNARDAMDGEGRLTIAVAPVHGLPAMRAHPAVDGDYIAVCVIDTGSGIAPDDLARIFEPFFTTKGVGEGTGLGLSQVFGFAKQSGGEVRVESRVGEGSSFVLYLPQTDAEIASTESTPGFAADGSGLCVLVVEDNVEVGEFATQTLAELGYGAHLAADGRSALDELAEHPARYDIVFSDIVMPGMSGIELAGEISRRHPALPIVLTSGYSQVLAQNGSLGFELLHKPYSIDKLSTAISKAVSRAGPSDAERAEPSP